MRSEIEERAKFDIIRYAQVWEDADLLIEALNIQPTDVVLSIASGGDNSFSLLAQNPQKVFAIDLNFSQIACLELRKVMYKRLTLDEHMAFGGVKGEIDRLAIFDALKQDLAPEYIEFWESNLNLIQKGFMGEGKFENYFRLFRRKVLPLVHSKKTIAKLIASKNEDERNAFYNKVWNNRRWKAVFNIFFSRFTMGRLGRDKEFFKFVEGSVADRILSRAQHALTTLDTSENPYLHYILQGKYTTAFPHALRPENYDKIRQNLDKIEFRRQSIEEFIANYDGVIGAFNLSDIFEYMSQDGMDNLYENMLSKSAVGTRFVYWNMLAPRKANNPRVETNEQKNKEYLLKDKAFFYSAFYLDEVVR